MNEAADVAPGTGLDATSELPPRPPTSPSPPLVMALAPGTAPAAEVSGTDPPDSAQSSDGSAPSILSQGSPATDLNANMNGVGNGTGNGGVKAGAAFILPNAEQVPEGGGSATGVIAHQEPDGEIIQQSPRGRYQRFGAVLGEGAFKVVYKAYDSLEGCEVAWNVVKLKGMPEREKKSVQKEVELLHKLKHHKNILNFRGCWADRENEEIIFITEILSAGSLKSYISRVKVIRWKVIKRWCRSILEGLAYLHNRDPPVIHRDLKCDNIFVNGNTGELRIGDLGLSRQLESRDTKDLNQSKYLTMAGTPAFMAPEFYSKEREGRYNEKVDIYAFGMCVLEMITQEYPYAECKSPVEIMKAVMAGTPPRVLERVKNQPAVDFITQCLHGLSDHRPSATALLQHPFMTDPTFDEDVALNRVPSSTAVAEDEPNVKNARFHGAGRGDEPTNIDPYDMSARTDRGADAEVLANGDAPVAASSDPNDVWVNGGASMNGTIPHVNSSGLDAEKPKDARPPVERTVPDQPQALEPNSAGSLGSEGDGARSEVVSREASPAPVNQALGVDRTPATLQAPPAMQGSSHQVEEPESSDLNHIKKIPSVDGSEGSNETNEPATIHFKTITDHRNDPLPTERVDIEIDFHDTEGQEMQAEFEFILKEENPDELVDGMMEHYKLNAVDAQLLRTKLQEVVHRPEPPPPGPAPMVRVDSYSSMPGAAADGASKMNKTREDKIKKARKFHDQKVTRLQEAQQAKREELQRQTQKVEKEIQVLKKKEIEEGALFQKRLQEIYDEFDSNEAAADQLATAAEATNQRMAKEADGFRNGS